MGTAGTQMSDLCRQAIQQTIGQAAASGETLFVASVAKRIAIQHGASPKEIADQLTEAGIKAGLTMQVTHRSNGVQAFLLCLQGVRSERRSGSCAARRKANLPRSRFAAPAQLRK
jgi:hypothetical protein